METRPSRVGVLMMLVLFACGGGGSPSATAPTGSTAPSASAAPSSSSATAATATGQPSAVASVDASKPPERPFAKTQGEALGLIDTAISARQKEIFACVAAARQKRKDPHADISIDIGIDQEGTLIGVKPPKGQTADEAFSSCMRAALSGAMFPRSNAGVITVNKKFSDQLVYSQ